jgi:hypothetical protein
MPDRIAFGSKLEAIAWMYEQVGEDECVDGERFAYEDDEKAMARYEDVKSDGCCGFFDRDISIAGRNAVIGCNYGH